MLNEIIVYCLQNERNEGENAKRDTKRKSNWKRERVLGDVKWSWNKVADTTTLHLSQRVWIWHSFSFLHSVWCARALSSTLWHHFWMDLRWARHILQFQHTTHYVASRAKLVRKWLWIHSVTEWHPNNFYSVSIHSSGAFCELPALMAWEVFEIYGTLLRLPQNDCVCVCVLVDVRANHHDPHPL